jgi:hypothetical protein
LPTALYAKTYITLDCHPTPVALLQTIAQQAPCIPACTDSHQTRTTLFVMLQQCIPLVLGLWYVSCLPLPALLCV